MEHAVPQTNSISQPPLTHRTLVGYLIVAGVFLVLGLIGGLWLGMHKEQSPIKTQTTGEDVRPSDMLSHAPSPTSQTIASPTPSFATYTFHTFSFTYPSSWHLYDSTSTPEFFAAHNLTGFDRILALEKNENYLIIGINKAKEGVGAGGIFVSDEDYQDYARNRDKLDIQGKSYYLNKGDSSITILQDAHREAGVYSLASLSEYIPNKVTNEQGRTFNGYDDLILNKNRYSFLFIKLSKTDTTLTPMEVQTDIKHILESIRW